MICTLRLYQYFDIFFISPALIQVWLFPFSYINLSIYLGIFHFLFFHRCIFFGFFILTFTHIFIIFRNLPLTTIHYFQSYLYFYLCLFSMTSNQSFCFDIRFLSFHHCFALLTSNYSHCTDLVWHFCTE